MKREKVVVLVDCWDYEYKYDIDLLEKNIKEINWEKIDWINRKDFLEIIKKTNVSELKENLENNIRKNLREIAYKNIEKFFLENKVETVIDFIEDIKPHPIINNVLNKRISYRIKSLKNFLDIISIKEKNLDIYYMGINWEHCIKKRNPIGWEYVFEVIKNKKFNSRILFKEKTILGVDEKQIEIWPNYEKDKQAMCRKVDDDIWELIKEIK